VIYLAFDRLGGGTTKRLDDEEPSPQPSPASGRGSSNLVPSPRSRGEG